MATPAPPPSLRGVYLVTRTDDPLASTKCFVPCDGPDTAVRDLAVLVPGVTFWYDDGPFPAPLPPTSSARVPDVAQPLPDSPGYYILRVTDQQEEPRANGRPVPRAQVDPLRQGSRQRCGPAPVLGGDSVAPAEPNPYSRRNPQYSRSWGLPVTSHHDVPVPNTDDTVYGEPLEGLTRRRSSGPQIHLPGGTQMETLADRLFRVLNHRRIGMVWNLWVMFLSVVGGVQYVIDSYLEDSNVQDLARWSGLVRLATVLFVLADVVLHAIVNPLETFLRSLSTWVDIISFVPVIITFMSSVTWDPTMQALVETARILPLLRTYRLMKLFTPKTVPYETFRLVWVVTMLVMCCSGVFSVLEPTLVPDFHNGVYFAIITITTVGYGDISPKSTGGKIFICVYILACMISLSIAINSVVDALRLAGWKSGRIRKTCYRRVVVFQMGPPNFLALHVFLREFFYGNAGYTASPLPYLTYLEPDFPCRGRRGLNG